MKKKYHYFTPDTHRNSNGSSFEDAIDEYLENERPVPVSRTINQITQQDIFFTFSDELMEKYKRDEKRHLYKRDENHVRKAYEVTLKYGFRGFSSGGKNGIFYMRRQDTPLLEDLDRLVKKHKKYIIEDLAIEEKQLDDLKPVKIVWHSPNGERIAGTFNESNNRIIFLGFVNY